MKIATSPFIYWGVAVFMPEKLGKLQVKDKTFPQFCQLSSSLDCGNGDHRGIEAAGRGGAGEGGRCGCRAEAGGRAGVLQGLGERRADRGGVTRQDGKTRILRV